MTKRVSEMQRLMRRIQKSANGCWLWQASRDKHGYGKFGLITGRWKLAHRASWEFHRGAIPDKTLVLHRCDTPACINPDHLFLGTHRENTRDMMAKGRAAFGSRGEAHPRAKFNPEIVTRIRQLSSDGARSSDIARSLGVTNTAIYSVLTGRTWSHVK